MGEMARIGRATGGTGGFSSPLVAKVGRASRPRSGARPVGPQEGPSTAPLLLSRIAGEEAPAVPSPNSGRATARPVARLAAKLGRGGGNGGGPSVREPGREGREFSS